MTRSIGLAGDVMLGRKVDERQRRRDAAAVWGDVLPRLQSLDGLFVNLECCLSTRGEPYTDTYHPFHFRADPAWALPALEAAGVDWAGLANNHVLDYGEEAMVDTLQALDSAGIVHAGAGRDAAEAFAPAAVPVGGGDHAGADDRVATDALDVAVVSLTDNVREWAAGPETPGVAHVRIDHEDPDVRETVLPALADARALDPDLLVASLHWGPNMTEGPDAARRGFGRWLVEAGVDVVFGHSAHAFHGVEVVDGGGSGRPGGGGPGLVLYDAGDFVDDYAVDADLRNDRGFLFVLEVADGGAIERLRLEPTQIDDCAVHRVDEGDTGWWHETMRGRTERFDLGTEYEVDGAALVVEVS